MKKKSYHMMQISVSVKKANNNVKGFTDIINVSAAVMNSVDRYQQLFSFIETDLIIKPTQFDST